MESVSYLIKKEKRKMKKGREGYNRKEEVQWAERSSSSGLQQEADVVTHCHTVTNCSNLHHIQYFFRARPETVTVIRLFEHLLYHKNHGQRQLLLYPRLQNSCVCAVRLCCKCVERTTTLTLRFSLLDTWRLNTPHGHEMESTKVTLWFQPKGYL